MHPWIVAWSYLTCVLRFSFVNWRFSSVHGLKLLEINAARQQDQAQIERTLAQLLQDDANILRVLGLQHGQTLDALRRLHNVRYLPATQPDDCG